MVVCDEPLIERWSPDFSSSGQSHPNWTRIRHQQTVLCNSLEWTDWLVNPVQVELCDVCGTVGCASGGYVHISVFDDFVLWTAPEDATQSDEVRDELFPATAIEKFGAIAFPLETWTKLQGVVTEVPGIASLSRADGRTLRDAWVVGPNRSRAVQGLLGMLQARLLGADTLDVDEAIRAVEFWLTWFDERGETAIDGILTSPAKISATLEKLYFDGPGSQDWLAFARTPSGLTPTLGPQHVFVANDRKSE